MGRSAGRGGMGKKQRTDIVWGVPFGEAGFASGKGGDMLVLELGSQRRDWGGLDLLPVLDQDEGEDHFGRSGDVLVDIELLAMDCDVPIYIVGIEVVYMKRYENDSYDKDAREADGIWDQG